MKENKFNYTITKEFNNYTLEKFFKYFHFGKEKTNSLVLNKRVYKNNVVITRKDEILQTNDIISLDILFEELVPYDMKIKILYEDEYLVVVDKPKCILIHSDGNTDKTLTNAVVNYLKINGKVPYAYSIHRIDYETTGIVVFAKNPLLLSYFSVEIEKHSFEKEYACLCHGRFEQSKNIINKCISRDRHSNKQIVCNGGKKAISHYCVIENSRISKVYVKIQHGRKHQIRVHMSSIKHPIVGDKIYGIKDNEFLKLHFRKITFYHPLLFKKISITCKERF